MSGVLVINPDVQSDKWYHVVAHDQYPRPSQEMLLFNGSNLRDIRTKAAVLGQILGVEVIDTTK